MAVAILLVDTAVTCVRAKYAIDFGKGLRSDA